MAYGDTTRARSLAGNPSTTNVSAADVTQAVAFADSLIETETSQTWATTDTEYELIQTISEYLASWYIRSRFSDPNGRAKDHKEFADMLLEKVKSGSTLIHIASQSHRTYPLNENATPYRSLSGANNSTDDSDLS